MKSNELGLYIHIPFCKAKCHYCDFNSYAGREKYIHPYFEALKKEIEAYREKMQKHIIQTVFIGGGTPSAVDKYYISELIYLCKNTFNIKDNAEITIECNPGTLDYSMLEEYRRVGINRLSMGLQAWQDNLLKKIGRIHHAEEFYHNVNLARKAGFKNINVDLIFGLPEQELDDWRETLEKVVELGVEHISCYSLKIEEGTLFGDMLSSGELVPMEDELDRKMYHYSIEYLTSNGYRQYEISNFAVPEYECKHNMVYWNANHYIGLGSGAHSYLDGKRFNNISSVEGYISNIKNQHEIIENIECIGRNDEIAEFIILGLRLISGISIKEFNQRFGYNILDMYTKKIDKLVKDGLLKMDCENIMLTPLGLDVANKVFVEFI